MSLSYKTCTLLWNTLYNYYLKIYISTVLKFYVIHKLQPTFVMYLDDLIPWTLSWLINLHDCYHSQYDMLLICIKIYISFINYFMYLCSLIKMNYLFSNYIYEMFTIISINTYNTQRDTLKKNMRWVIFHTILVYILKCYLVISCI